jgi:hypothetical protein
MSEAIIKRLSEAFTTAAGRREVVLLVIYTPFGIVRGELTEAQLRAAAQGREGGGLIELQRAVVEHYSNHLPTGNYATLCVSLQGISGFVILPE